MKPKKLGELWKRQDELKLLINSYEAELREIELHISRITGEPAASYKQVYDDENPYYIQNTEDGI